MIPPGEHPEDLALTPLCQAVELLLLAELDHLRRKTRIGAVFQQHSNYFCSIASGGERERGLLPFRFPRVDVGPRIEQGDRHVRVARGGGKVERRRSTVGGHGVHVATRIEQVSGDLRAPPLGREVKRSVLADPRDGLGIGAGVDQHARESGVPALRGPVERGHPIALRRVDVQPLLQQLPDHVDLTPHRSVRDRRLGCGPGRQEHAHAERGSRLPGLTRVGKRDGSGA